MSALLDNVLSRLDKVKKQGNGYVACCPVHGDNHPSMSVKEVDGRILMHCHACHADIQEIAQSAGLNMSDLFEESLNDKQRLTLDLGRTQRELDSLENKIYFYQQALEAGQLTAQEKITYVNYIERRRQGIIQAKQLRERLLEI